MLHTFINNPRLLRARLPFAGIAFALFVSCPSLFAADQKPLLPAADVLRRVVDEAYARHKDDHGGKNADYIPYLASVPSNLFGIAIVTVDGRVFTAGDVNYGFAIESVSKPFTLCLALQENGAQAILNKIGVEPTGMPFNSVIAIELRKANPSHSRSAMTFSSSSTAKLQAGEDCSMTNINMSACQYIVSIRLCQLRKQKSICYLCSPAGNII